MYVNVNDAGSFSVNLSNEEFWQLRAGTILGGRLYGENATDPPSPGPKMVQLSCNDLIAEDCRYLLDDKDDMYYDQAQMVHLEFSEGALCSVIYEEAKTFPLRTPEIYVFLLVTEHIEDSVPTSFM
jgi:hypothetical protein